MEFKEFLVGLQGIVGVDNVVYHSDDLLVFEYDGSVDRGLPEAGGRKEHQGEQRKQL